MILSFDGADSRTFSAGCYGVTITGRPSGANHVVSLTEPDRPKACGRHYDAGADFRKTDSFDLPNG